MFFLVGVIFTEFLNKYEQKWENEKEASQWQKWEECEMIRNSIGHTTDIVKIPKYKRPPRKKHHH